MSMMKDKITRHHFAEIDGRRIFYREAGDPAAPAIILLHGFPTSSFMFRNLIPLLADRFHVIAPDYIGFGQSDAPAADAFDYTFDNLADHVAKLVEQIGLTSYVLYMQDYGGPIGFRLMARNPAAVTGLVIQNANAYLDGIGEAAKQLFVPLWEDRNAETEAAARGFLTAETTRFQYEVGASDVTAISPDNWLHDQALLDRPGTDEYQLNLLADYQHNVGLYDSWHEMMRSYAPPTLLAWGRHDPFFIPAGAEAYLRDLPNARLVWLEGGHFVLDEHAYRVADEITQLFAPSPVAA